MDTSVEKALEDNQQNLENNESKKLGSLVDDYLEQKKSFEEDRIELAKNSAKTAWKCVCGAGVIAILSVGAVIGLTPLKEVQPYMIMVDSLTGNTEVVKPFADAKKTSYGDALDRYWVKTFIDSRNSYEWETIQTGYSTVKLMSADKVFLPYQTYIRGDNSPTEVFKNLYSVEVKIKAIRFLPTSTEDNRVVLVQFSREIKNRNGEPAPNYKKTIWEATLTFDYLASINTEDERLLNPLGFNVTSYKENTVIE